MSDSGGLLHAATRVRVQAQRRAIEAGKIASPGSAEACGSVIHGLTILAVVPARDASKGFRPARPRRLQTSWEPSSASLMLRRSDLIGR